MFDVEEFEEYPSLRNIVEKINKVEAQRGKAITTEQADVLIAQAELVIDIILTNH